MLEIIIYYTYKNYIDMNKHNLEISFYPVTYLEKVPMRSLFPFFSQKYKFS